MNLAKLSVGDRIDNPINLCIDGENNNSEIHTINLIDENETKNTLSINPNLRQAWEGSESLQPPKLEQHLTQAPNMGNCINVVRTYKTHKNYTEEMKLRKDLCEATKKSTPYFSYSGITAKVKCVDVYDGDTITVVGYLCFDKIRKYKIRLSGIDTPELRTKNPDEKQQGILVRNFVRSLILGKLIYIQCGEFDKYGRILAKVYTVDNLDKSINDLLIEKKYAYKYNGGTKKK